MKIKMLVSMAGVLFAHSPGDIVEKEDAEAGRLINAGYAIPIAPEPVVETRKAKAKAE